MSGRGAPPSLGLPSPKACRSGRIAFRVPRVKGRRYARVLVYVDGRPVRTLRGRALRRLVRLRLGSGRSRVTLVAVTTEGKRFAATRQYTCARPRRRPASRRT